MNNKNVNIIIVIVLVVLLAAGTIFGYVIFKDKSPNEVVPEPVKPMNYQANDFDINFLKLENDSNNMIYSPLSIRYALSMLKDGTDGNTLAEIENVLGNSELPLYYNINNQLSLANSLFIRSVYRQDVNSDYINSLNSKYNVNVMYDDFKNTDTINDWIEDKTFGLIDKVVDNEVISNADLKLLLINALAINLDWKLPFDPKDTYSGKFYGDKNNIQDVAMMNMHTKSNSAISYNIGADATAVGLDLVSIGKTNLQFIAIMPKNNLYDYVKNLTYEKITNINNNLNPLKDNQEFNLSIPKFSYDSGLKLKDDLKSLGINEVFTPMANLSKMAVNNDLYVDNAIHKANIDFTEKGIKASAVTVIYLTAGVSPMDDEVINITFNKPFMYIIRDKSNDSIWFVGTVYNPNSWENEQQYYEYR